MNGQLLTDAIPELAREIEHLLIEARRRDLAAQVGQLRIIDRCRCGDDYCATFYTVPPPKGAWGRGHENVLLEPERGMLILDVVDRKITCIELLYRDEIRDKLLKVMP